MPIPDCRIAASFSDSLGAVNEFQTLLANYNGGFYVVDCGILADLGSSWARWARWLLDAALIPTRYAVHVDQIAFCVAAHDLGLDTMALDSVWNFPSHIRTAPSDASPFVVHHHGRLDDALRLLPLSPPCHEASLAGASSAVSAFLRRHGVVPAAQRC